MMNSNQNDTEKVLATVPPESTHGTGEAGGVFRPHALPFIHSETKTIMVKSAGVFYWQARSM